MLPASPQLDAKSDSETDISSTAADDGNTDITTPEANHDEGQTTSEDPATPAREDWNGEEENTSSSASKPRRYGKAGRTPTKGASPGTDGGEDDIGVGVPNGESAASPAVEGSTRAEDVEVVAD